jgi:sulfur-carrier protein
MIRVLLTPHLRTVVHVEGEVNLELDGPATQRAVLDALETFCPMLQGSIQDPATQQRPFLRFFVCEQDLSHELPDALLPDAIASATEPF